MRSLQKHRDRAEIIISIYTRTSWKNNRSNEARIDIRADGFWERGRQAFFGIIVFDPKRL